MKVLSQYLPVLWENKTIVNRKFLHLHPLHISYSYFLVLRAQLPVPGRTNGGGERENLFQKVAVRKTRCAYILEKKLIRETGVFSTLSIWFSRKKPETALENYLKASVIWNYSRENSPNLISCFVLFFFTPSCQTFRDEPHHISF